MRYTDLNDLRLRANRIGVVLNAASDYGHKPFPKQYTDVEREWLELADVWFNAKRLNIKDGVEIKEAAL